MSSRLDWTDPDAFTLNGTAFQIEVFARARSWPERFILAKPRWMLDEYLALAPQMIGGRVVELGIAQGGSIAFFAHLLAPAKLLAVDLATEPNAALAAFLGARGYESTVRTEYGVDQGDRARLAALVDEHFGRAPLDLVIDDASHLLGPSIESFDVLFPRIRPGGVLVLEDWSHQHTWERLYRTHPEAFTETAPDEPAREEAAPDDDLTWLVLAIGLAAAYAPEVVAEVRIREGFAVITRGDAELDPSTFELTGCYGDAGRRSLRSRR